jgi:hypothetical protein
MYDVAIEYAGLFKNMMKQKPFVHAGISVELTPQTSQTIRLHSITLQVMNFRKTFI